MLSYTLLLNFVTDLKACHLHNMAGTFNIASAALKANMYNLYTFPSSCAPAAGEGIHMGQQPQ